MKINYKEIIKSLAISLLLAIGIRYFIFQPFKVEGASMEPIFTDGDYLIVDELSFHFRDIKRGETIVFHHGSSYFIKRVIGLPGETVTINNGYVYINKHMLDELDFLAGKTYGNTEVVLGEDEYFVLGDNRTSSSDSRVFGPLKQGQIIGRVWVRLMPINKINLFHAIY